MQTELFTLSQLSALTGWSIAKLRYAQRRAGITPGCRAGTVKLFDLESASKIVAKAARIRPYRHRQARCGRGRS